MDAGFGRVTVSAHDVAGELRRRLPSPGVVKIHKLLYYVQGWHLAINGSPAFDEGIEAWTNGPVVANLWRDENHSYAPPPPSTLGDELLATIDYVLARYGALTEVALIRQTHLEDPWRDASESEAAGLHGNVEIVHTDLQRWFERDDERIAYLAEVRRLSSANGADPFRPAPNSPDERSAVLRAVSGEQVRHTRPA